ncbi:amidohydrolase [Rhodococcus sp. IEGM 1408]|uniref:amidohydrolase n=1 Tax=Rhodococcus sp. IEGM 1408 TaxID=3082220 RepID=UPI002954E72C|nr:amidohydrolase [Rhodococcus sp. IEGM 1408]MDV8000189.1 amidohydrolase [Rhodococcus sp. IEGM 1408]
MTAFLATGGRVLTPASRDATALAHENGVIVWAGSDAPGPALFPDAQYVDLEGDWVAPAFVECLASGLDAGAAAARGVIPAPIPEPHALDLVADRVRAGERVVLGADADPVEVAAELTRLAAELGGPAVARCTPVLVGALNGGSTPIDDQTLAALASVGTVIVLRPLVDDLTGTDLVRIAASGVALAASVRAGSAQAADEVRPWDALRNLTSVSGGRGLSPRAAFTAVTRGARRAAGARDGTSGTLTPGTPATFARWQTGALAVVAAYDAVQRWSTDPRSGVPPMPDLSGPDPVLRELVVDGLPSVPSE